MFKRMLAGALSAAAVAALALPGAASAAPAVDTAYFNQVASTLKTQSSHVYVDPKASPTITGAQLSILESQIVGTRKSIYVVMLDNDKALATGSSANLLNALHQSFVALGNNAQVIGASTNKGFYANGFNEPAVANQAGPLAKSALASSGKNPFNTYTTWVTSVAAVQVPASVPTITRARSGNTGTSNRTSTAAPAPQKQGHGWAIFWIILATLVLLGVVYWLALRLMRGKQLTARKARIDRELSGVNTDLMDIDSAVQLHGVGKSSQSRAFNFVQKGQTALTDGDLESAEEYLEHAQSALQAAQAEIDRAENPVQPQVYTPPQSFVSSVPDDEDEPVVTTSSYSSSSQSSGNSAPRSIRARRSDGTTVVVNQTTYQPQQTQMPGFSHYYDGGNYNGIYMQPGFYADPFWNYVMMEEIFDHHDNQDGSYADGYRDGEREDNQNNSGDVDNSPATGTADGGDWNDGNTADDWSNPSADQQVDAGTTDGSSWGGSDTGTDSGSTDSGSSWSNDPAPADNSGWDSGSSGVDTSSTDSGGGWGGGDSGGYDSGSSFDSGSSDSGGGW
jgi:flagellar biogenesis protein FliO